MILNPAGLAAVAALIRESSDLSPQEAVTAATAVIEAYFVAAGQPVSESPEVHA